MDLALKSSRIVDLCSKLSGFADFENTVDRGSAVIFDADSGFCCLMLGPWNLKEIWITDLSSAVISTLLSFQAPQSATTFLFLQFISSFEVLF